MTYLGKPISRSCKPEDGLLDPPIASCWTEAHDLLAISNILTTANPKLGVKLDDWRQRVNDLLAGPMVDDLATERRLEELAMDFRQQWMILAHSVVAGEMKSPPSDHLSIMPVSLSHTFIYERVLGPWQAEEKLKKTVPVIPGWQNEVTLFSSGLAAITAAIIALRHLKDKYRRADGHALRLDMFGGYFETLRLLDLLSSLDLCCQYFQDQEILFERFSNGKTDILFLELIAYDWIQTVVDPTRLLDALSTRAVDHPWILLVDTTLLGPMFHLGPLLDACGEKKPILVLEIRSGLKLDQVGLEFSNVGIIRTLTPEDLDTNRYPDAKQFHQTLKGNRKILGNALTLSQIAILDAPWIFHPEWMLKHSLSVLDNNRRLAFALSGIQGLFSRVNHPGLGPQSGLSWAESPIVVMEFHAFEDQKDNHDFLLAVIAHEVRKRKLVFHLGASFGFRHHRCEVINPKGPYCYPDSKLRSFFKVAMGSRNGPSMDGTIKLMQELASYPHFRALRTAYPEIKPERELAAFPNLRSLRLFR